MKKIMENDINRIGYYSVIPATILFNKELKPNEKLLYALITSLSNKEGYCYASNKYLASHFDVDPVTISKWLTNLRRHNFIYVEIQRNENKEIINRKIFPNDVPYRLNNLYPYSSKCQGGIDEKVKENNIKDNNINTYIVAKQNYADNVLLYDFEYMQLVNEYGEDKAKRCIDELSLYKKSKGVEYESDYATIKRWVVISVDEKEARKNKVKSTNKSNSFMNYEQREYSPEFFDSLYENAIKNVTTEVEEEDGMEM